MGRLRIAECNFKEIDRQLKEQFIHKLNDNDMMVEIIKDITKNEENKDVTGNQVLLWPRQVEVQRTQMAFLNSFKVNQEFNTILSEKAEKIQA